MSLHLNLAPSRTIPPPGIFFQSLFRNFFEKCFVCLFYSLYQVSLVVQSAAAISNATVSAKKVRGNEKLCYFSNMLKYIAKHKYYVFSSSKDRSAHVFQCKKRKKLISTSLSCLGLFVLQQNYVHVIFNVYSL
jgi:hypothetical protein